MTKSIFLLFADDPMPIGVVLSVCALGVVLFALIAFAHRLKFSARSLAYAAICISMSFTLGRFGMFQMPFGGKVTYCSLLPLVLYAYCFGGANGIFACGIYGVLDLLAGGTYVNPIQILLDYILAYALIGLAGFLRDTKPSFIWGCLVGAIGRYACVVVSGVVYWGMYIQEPFTNVWAYSLVYNLYVFVDIALVAIVLSLLMLSGPFKKLVNGVKLQEEQIN